MKKTMVSLAAVAAITTGAFAADKGIDIVTTGQAVVYYQTADIDVAGDAGFFDKDNSAANVGLQLNLNADLKNNFTFGSQLTYLGTAGLEKNLVTSVMQTGGTTVQGSTTDDIALTKIFVAKKIANTTVKIGRQELPKSLSPLAYTEGWNVFKNTFDAILVVNTDLPNTTLVGAYVSGGTAHSLGTTADNTTAGLNIVDGAYMLTAQTTAIPMTTLTGSYYTLHGVNQTAASAGISADAYWIDAKIAGKDLPMGLKIGLQYGNIDPDTIADTTAFGIKASIKPMDALTVCAAYTDVDNGVVSVQNVGTGIKSPLFTQMVANQGSISLDADTMMLKAVYSLGDMGTIILQGTDTDDNSAANDDLTEIDAIYKVKAGGVDYLAAYVMRDYDVSADVDVIRFWARYNF